MAKKKVTKVIKLQIPAGKANPAPPIGPALGSAGVNIMEFCKRFNDESSKKRKPGEIIPVILEVYADRTFDFIMKQPPVSYLIRTELGIEKGSGKPHAEKVGKINDNQVEKIAQVKMQDMQATSLDAAKQMVRGAARSMGVIVES